VDRRTLIAVIVAILGTALLVGGVDRSVFHARTIGWITGFASAFVFAFYVIMSKRGLARYPPETVLFYTFGIAGLFWACVTPPWRIVAAGYGGEVWILFAVLGAFSTLVPFALFYAGLRRLPAAQAGIVATLEPVVAVLAAAVFLKEGLGALQWVGAACVLAASALTSARAPELAAAGAERA
jgi:drug/metabolite transporter (DMT)-like permease